MPVKIRVTNTAVRMSVRAAKVVYIGGEPYTGIYTVTPLADNAVILPTSGKLMEDDVVVKKIPFFETSNQDGTTVYIGSEV